MLRRLTEAGYDPLPLIVAVVGTCGLLGIALGTGEVIWTILIGTPWLAVLVVAVGFIRIGRS